jgi:hypothetical protein
LAGNACPVVQKIANIPLKIIQKAAVSRRDLAKRIPTFSPFI